MTEHSPSDRRPLDHGREEALAEFLDRHLYPEIASTTERADGFEKQKQGIDMEATIDAVGAEIVIDEKAQADYLNDPVPSFVLELNFVNQGGNLHPGWFFDESKQTEYYLFIWGPETYLYGITDTDYGQKVAYDFPYDEDEIAAVKSLDWDSTHRTFEGDEEWWEFDYTIDAVQEFEEHVAPLPDSIRDRDASVGDWVVGDRSTVTAALVNRKTLQNFLAAEGFDEARVKEDARAIREKGAIGDHDPGDEHDFKYYLSGHKAEKPLNIVMNYSLIHELARETYTITAEEVTYGDQLFS
jgi:hypothetical protein